MSRCKECPIAPDQDCVAITTRCSRLCDLAAVDPAYRRHVQQLSGQPLAPPRSPEPEPGQLPPLWKQAANLSAALVRHVAAGMPTTPTEIQAARLAICQACPRYQADSQRCGTCGCYVAVKAAWEQESCPEGRW